MTENEFVEFDYKNAAADNAVNAAEEVVPAAPEAPAVAAPAESACTSAPADIAPEKSRKGIGRAILILLLALAVGGAGFYIGNQKIDRIVRGGDESGKGSESAGSSQTDSESTEPAGESTEAGAQESTNESGYPWNVPSVIKEIDGLTYIQIAAKACPSVVEIDTETVTTGFWNQEYLTAGAGSGVIISDDGYILTNNHVIEDTTTIIVRLTTGEEYEARLIGLDETLDIALLKIEAEGLVPAEIGTSANLKVGQEVVAIGNPMGNLGGTVTNGIVSAVNRKIAMSNSNVMSLIQTNAAINPGNSGGGLFDAAGRLIGIVNAKMADEEIEGLGFAIPVDDVLAILDDLYDYGYVRTGKVALGLTMIDINSASKAWQYGVSTLGIYIYEVDKGSSAETAGLRSGDRVLSVNGESVESTADMERLMADLAVGDSFEIEVARRAGNVTVTLVCEEYIPAAVKDARYSEK